MSQATPQQDGVFGFYRPSDTNSEFNALYFLIQSLIGGVNVATLVQVKAVHATGRGGIPGTVDVVPLTSLVDGTGAAWPHTTVFGLPFFRPSGGAGAFVSDPMAGDIGIVLFCDRDISAVKATGVAATPNSARRFSFSDGIYFGGWSRVAPTTSVILDASGCEITSNVNLTSGGVFKVAGTQVVGPQQPNVANPGPGVTEDLVLRVQFSLLLSMLQAHGLMA